MRAVNLINLHRWPWWLALVVALTVGGLFMRSQPAAAVTPTTTPTLTPGQGNYIVQYGDTLLTIARRFGVTVAALKSANGLTSDTIYAGEVLKIPAPVPAATRTPTPVGQATYVVQPGDQLLVIARRFGVTTRAIRIANGLASDNIYAGQVLIIPPPAPTQAPIPPGQSYTVQPGDQLLRIARRFGVTLSALKAANQLTSDTIQPGQVLVIPTAPPPTATPKTTATALPGNTVIYTVRAGDRLTRIAALYGVTIDAIKSANKLSTDTLQPGQILVILNPTLHPIEYIVQRGDTLTSLAARFGTTIEAIKLANRMKGDTIFAGLVLIIPSK